MSSQSPQPPIAPRAPRLARAPLLQPLLAAALGLVILFGVGFSHIEAFHNAAHDTRHSAGFPCH